MNRTKLLKTGLAEQESSARFNGRSRVVDLCGVGSESDVDGDETMSDFNFIKRGHKRLPSTTTTALPTVNSIGSKTTCQESTQRD